MTYSKYAHARDLEICNEDVFFERFTTTIHRHEHCSVCYQLHQLFVSERKLEDWIDVGAFYFHYLFIIIFSTN